MQADTIIPQPGNPRAWDRYAYSLNNPQKYVDPDGHDPKGPGSCYEPDDPGCQTSSTTKYTNYNSRESAMEAAGLVINWFLELGPDTYIYTQENSLTMDVMASPGIAEFKDAWAAEDYATPFTYHQTIDDRGQGITPNNIGIFFREHFVDNAFAQLGLGSKQAEGTVDSVGGVIGSLDRIDAVQYDENNIAIVVHNRMDWASATRFPGEDISLLPSKSRSDVPFGGTIWQIFYWIEPNPTP